MGLRHRQLSQLFLGELRMAYFLHSGIGPGRVRFPPSISLSNDGLGPEKALELQEGVP